MIFKHTSPFAETVRSYGNSMFNFLRNFQAFSKVFPYHCCRRAPISLQPHAFLFTNNKLETSEKAKTQKAGKGTLEELPWYTLHKSLKKTQSCTKGGGGLCWLLLNLHSHPCPLQLHVRQFPADYQNLFCLTELLAWLMGGSCVTLNLHQVQISYPGLETTESHWELRDLAVVLPCKPSCPCG